MKLGLDGKTALITAASGGIGSGIAAALADAGVHVAISGRTSTALEHVAGRLASCSGGRPAIVVGDVVRKAVPLGSRTKPWRLLAGASTSSSTTPVVRGPSQTKQTMRSGTRHLHSISSQHGD